MSPTVAYLEEGELEYVIVVVVVVASTHFLGTTNDMLWPVVRTGAVIAICSPAELPPKINLAIDRNPPLAPLLCMALSATR